MSLWFLILLFHCVRGWGIARDSLREEDNMIKFIFPGTKWCGSGSVAEDENDLGSHPETDSCCRDHDMCPDVIEAGGSKHGLSNHAPYTRLHCDCDDQFKKCLRNSTDDMKVSQVVGTLYFDLLRTKCYKLEHQVTGCSNYNTIAMRCEEYTMDPSTPKSWQWFDVPVFHI
ncbi:hypothetical protein GE061_018925 [Apolygus lucorum]|uniref:Phospholipase A2 n=2 Tax=Mirini TaxID=236659 RepID=A0A6A4JQ37_APOLU|nr:hypothetical protein GE061_018925 [Apolygus lucorum]